MVVIDIALVLICVLAINQFMLFIFMRSLTPRKRFEEFRKHILDVFVGEIERSSQNMSQHNRDIRRLHNEFYEIKNRMKKNSKTVNIDTQEVENDKDNEED